MLAQIISLEFGDQMQLPAHQVAVFDDAGEYLDSVWREDLTQAGHKVQEAERK